jgi:hypothetical protein
MDYPLAFDICLEVGGHCWGDMQARVHLEPVVYTETCKHCGATRQGVVQEPMKWEEPEPPSTPETRSPSAEGMGKPSSTSS